MKKTKRRKKIKNFNYIENLKKGSAFAKYLDKTVPKMKFNKIFSQNLNCNSKGVNIPDFPVLVNNQKQEINK